MNSSNRELALELTYFHRGLETVFFGNPKCASTSLQALFASSEGVSVEDWCDSAVYGEIGWEQALGQTRAKGVLSGQWLSLDEESRRVALNDPSLSRIAFVREPMARAWSAWLSKVCFREPEFRHLAPSVHELGTSQWIGRVCELELAIGEFEEFVSVLVSGGPAGDDIHFAPQSSFLADIAADTQFLDFSEVNSVLISLQKSRGLAIRTLPRFNSTGFPFPLEMVSEETRSVLADFYADDFLAFGYSVPRVAGCAWSPDEARRRWSDLLPAIRLRVQAAQRLAVALDELGRQARVLGEERDHAIARAEALGTHAKAVEHEALALRADRDAARAALATVYGSTSWRLTRPGRAIGEAIRRR